MNLPKAPEKYAQDYMNRLSAAIERMFRGTRQAMTDIELGDEKLVLRSPDGARWKIKVSNAGVISAEAL